MNNSISKAIDIVAKIFAGIIIVSIAVGVLETAVSLIDRFSGAEDKEYSSEMTVMMKDVSPGANLDIDIKSADISIKTGDTFSYYTNSKYIKVKSENNTVKITESRHLEDSEVTLVIPENQTFSSVKIDSGAGDIHADDISCKKLRLNLGAGDITIDTLTVLNNAQVNSGAGNITVSGGSVKDFDCNLGAGNTEINSEFSGKSSFECAAGSLDVILLGERDSYTLSVDHALGDVMVNGDSAGSGTIGNGPNKVEFDCALGDVNIQFPESQL